MGSWPVANPYAPDANVVGNTRHASGADSDGKTNTIGAYVIDTMNFNEQWQLTAGLRIGHYSTDYSATSLSTAAA